MIVVLVLVLVLRGDHKMVVLVLWVVSGRFGSGWVWLPSLDFECQVAFVLCNSGSIELLIIYREGSHWISLVFCDE